MLQNKFLIAFLALASFAFSQEKKGDTIYVYEEVIVHDTVYIEKPLLKIDKAIFTYKDDKKDMLELTQNGKKIQIAIDTLVLVTNKKQDVYRKSWFFGGKLHLGVASNSLFKQLGSSSTPRFGLGIFAKKQIFNPNFSVGLGFETCFSTGNFNLDAAQNDSSLNGYYFTDDGSPKLFKSITNKGFQFQIPLQVYWKVKKYTPSIGVFGNLSNYKSTFLGSSGALPLLLDTTETYTAKAFYIGYLAQLEYQLSNQWSVAINYSFATAKKLVFKDNSDNFAIDQKIHENSFGVDLLYHF